MTTRTTTAPAAWLWNPWADLIVGCAGWTLPVLALTDGLARTAGVQLAFVFALLTLVCNHPHYMATVQRAFASRERRSTYRLYTLHLTVLLAGAAIALFLYPRCVPLFFTLYVVWSPWHYSGQNFGLLLLFARRAQAGPAPAERRLLQVAFSAAYLVWLLTVQSRPSADPYVWSLDLPAGAVNPVALALTLCFLIAGSVALGRVGDRAGWRAVVPPAVLLSTQALWFVAPWLVQVAAGRGVSPVYYSTGALAFMHCAQYLWITSFSERRECGASRWRPAHYAAVLVLGGIALFTAGPWLASALTGVDLRESTLIFVALVNLHHFILDGVLWKLRDRRVAALLIDPAPSVAPAPALARPLRPGLRWGLAAALVALAAVNVAQQYLTLDGADARRLDLAHRLNPHDTRVDVRRAELLAEDQRTDDALRVLTPLLEPRPANAASLRLYGSLLVASGRYDEALTHLRSVQHSVGLDPPGLVNIGVLLARSGQLDDAASALRQALRLDPELLAAHLNLAGICLQRGDGPCALAHYLAYLAAPGVPHDRDYATATLNAAGAAVLAHQRETADALLREGAALAGRLGGSDLAELANRQAGALVDGHR